MQSTKLLLKKPTLLSLSLLLVMLLLSVNGYAHDKQKQPQPRQASMQPYTPPDTPIILKKSNPIFTVRLKSNPTTGYSWFLVHYNSNLLKPVNHKYIPSQERHMGAGGLEQWTFKAKPAAFVVPHLLKIKMLYAQPWELEDSNKVIFSVITH